MTSAVYDATQAAYIVIRIIGFQHKNEDDPSENEGTRVVTTFLPL